MLIILNILKNLLFISLTSKIKIKINSCGGQLIPYVQIALERARSNTQSEDKKVFWGWPVKEEMKTTLRKEVKNIYVEFNRIRG